MMKPTSGPRRLAVLTAAISLSLTACAVGAGGDEGGSFYAGETVDLVVPYDPGGGYDVYARNIAPHLGKCLDATVTVRNEPGAGSLLATNKTANTDPNERRLQILNMGGAAASQLAGADGVSFDLRKFTYAGRIASAPDVVVTGPKSKFKDFGDVVGASDEVSFVSTGVGSLESITAGVLISAYDLPGKIVTGFTGSDEARTAVTAAEADLHSLPFDSHLAALESGDVKGLVLVSDEAPDLVPDVPLITDYPAKGKGRGIIDGIVKLGQLGRVIAGPPGMSGEQTAELREGFECAMNDKELLAKLDEQKRPVVLADGEEVLDQVNEVFDASPEFVEAVKNAFKKS